MRGNGGAEEVGLGGSHGLPSDLPACWRVGLCVAGGDQQYHPDDVLGLRRRWVTVLGLEGGGGLVAVYNEAT